MKKISNQIWENMSIDEIYKYRTQWGELQCHRINMPDCMAGELIINVPVNEKAVTIEEVFVDRKFRNTGIGSKLLAFAEKTAIASGFQKVELRLFSTDPLVSDIKLQEWYMKSGYQPDEGKMYKRMNNQNLEVTS